MASSHLRWLLYNSLKTKGKSLLNRNVFPTTAGKLPNLFRHHRHYSTFPKLTPQQVNRILRAYESSEEIVSPTSVKSFDTNQLPSNNPIEDRRLEARCRLTTGMLFGIFDGHGGSACSEVICQRLLHYIAAALLPNDLLKELATSLKSNEPQSLLDLYNNEVIFSQELCEVHKKSFIKFVEHLVQTKQEEEFEMQDALTDAFLQLDNHMSEEAQNQSLSQTVHADTVVTAATGSVACVVHIDGPHLHVAQVGDCQAVLASLDEANVWQAKLLTVCHNADNEEEVKRILSEHPQAENQSAITNQRLLGQLAPLRAFGDFRFKWTEKQMKDTFVPLLGPFPIPSNYHTPPYLTAKPDVTYTRLSPRDKFLVIGSDGLWDMLQAEKVVKLVGEYMQGMQTLDPVVLPKEDVQLSEILSILNARKEGRNLKPMDQNAATHLIRNALGGTEFGVEHSILSQMLSAPEDVVRLIRDDITIQVIFINDDYIRHCPA